MVISIPKHMTPIGPYPGPITYLLDSSHPLRNSMTLAVSDRPGAPPYGHLSMLRDLGSRILGRSVGHPDLIARSVGFME